MPHYGIAYLALFAAVVLVGAPIVWLAQKAGGPDEGRDEFLWFVAALGTFVGGAWVLS
jgi:hypothetical protein